MCADHVSILGRRGLAVNNGQGERPPWPNGPPAGTIAFWNSLISRRMDGHFMELALTPSGRITLHRTTDSPETVPDAQLGRLAKAFENSQGEGLFLLATERFDGPACRRRSPTGGSLPPAT